MDVRGVKCSFVIAVAMAAAGTWINVQAANISVDLCAKAGNLSLPDGTVVPIWGYVTKPAGVACADPSVVATLPGPVLRVNIGDTLNVTLHNALPQNVSLLFPGQNLVPDHAGAAQGVTRTYAVTAQRPGTFLYESGINSAIQVPMGLYGALVVHPAIPNQAYENVATAYDREALLVLSEIDPLLHADPTAFNPASYAPKYWLINGKAFPQTAPIPIESGRLLLRYVNAGLIHQTMETLGAHQRVIANDAHPLTYAYDLVAQTLAAGQTADAIVQAPGTRVAIFSRQLHITNGVPTANPAHFPGGMVALSGDNCSGAANNNQRDTDNDGIGNSCDPDLNQDNIVNFADLAILRAGWLATSSDATYNPNADLNGDGVINFADLAILRSRWLQPPGPSNVVL